MAEHVLHFYGENEPFGKGAKSYALEMTEMGYFWKFSPTEKSNCSLLS